VFTGIIEELGELADTADLGTAARFTVRGPIVTAGARHGDSIAVNGVCLTVVDVRDGAFTADVMKETLDRSSLGALAPGDPVNLERAATLSTRMGGHLVQGHVDGTGTLLAREPDEHWEVVRFSLPAELARYVVEKGSITVDGVSLTVNGIGVDSAPGRSGLNWFEVSLIPTTLGLTTLGKKAPGAPVNLEVDVIAKYTEKLLAGHVQGERA
jgi:riboflavin synthase